jgi:hypothetical protein
VASAARVTESCWTLNTLAKKWVKTYINSGARLISSDKQFYHLVNIQKAIEAMAIEVVDLPSDSMMIFHS